MKLIEGPKVCHPMNAIGGLYMLVLRERSKPLEDYYPELKRLAAEHGYNPEGKTTVGMPSGHGLGTVTNAVWFHDRLGQFSFKSRREESRT